MQCKCYTINDTDSAICKSCNEIMVTMKSMQDVLTEEDMRQIGIFLAGCCNINSHYENTKLLFDGYMGHNLNLNKRNDGSHGTKYYNKYVPNDVIALCVAFCYNLEPLNIKINESYNFKDVWDTYPFTSNIAKLTQMCRSTQIWTGKKEIDYNTMRRIWRFRVTKSNEKCHETQFSFTIGICETQNCTKNYLFHIMNGYIGSSKKLIIKNDDILSLVYVKYETMISLNSSSSYTWKGKLRLFLNDVPYSTIIDTKILSYFEYFRLEVQLFDRIQLEMVS